MRYHFTRKRIMYSWKIKVGTSAHDTTHCVADHVSIASIVEFSSSIAVADTSSATAIGTVFNSLDSAASAVEFLRIVD